MIVASKRDDPVVRIGVVGEEEAHQLEHRDIQRGARAEKRRIGQAALDDDFDVAQSVPNDGRRKRQRHEAERNRRQLQGERRIDAERPGQRVAEGERSDAQRRAPRNPPQLTTAGQRGDLVERTGQHDHGRHGAQEQVHRLGAVEHVQRAREQLPVRPRDPRSDGHDSAEPSTNAGTYTSGSQHPLALRPTRHGDRSGNTSVKCSSSGGSAVIAIASPQ